MTMPTRAVASGATVLLLIGLAGCARSSNPADADHTPAPSPVQDVATLAVGTADVEFAQMMIVHHRDALTMAAMAEARTTNPAIRDLASRITAAQGPEIDLMASWLQTWGAEVPMDSEMDPMAHGETMPGEMSDAQMTALADATGADFDSRFLGLMIEHHSGAVLMAEDMLEAGSDPEALALAQQIAAIQMLEIEEMRALLGAS